MLVEVDEGSKILHAIEGTLLKEEIFAEFDEFIAMTADENSDFEYDTKEPPFEKITINIDYKIKTYLKEPPMDLELKPLSDNLEYVFLEEPSFLPIMISSQLSKEKKSKLLSVLKKYNKILHSIEGTLLKEEIFAEFDEFIAMTADENSDFEYDTKEPPFEKITINIDYKIKTYLKEPPMDLELKPLSDNLEYVFLEEPSFLPIMISSQLSKEKKSKLLSVLKKY
nr:reverse transcriptase domain-containing protein [Tanacetum cinerariifolium]